MLIYFLVFYFCLYLLIINWLFLKFSILFRVVGFVEKSWGDWLICYLFFDFFIVVVCNDCLLVIVLFDGSVLIYWNIEFSLFEFVGIVLYGGRV